MRADKPFVLAVSALFVGFVIGFAAGLDNPPAQNDLQWETLLAGAVAIVGGWMAYLGATAPFREKQKTKNLKFFMNMRNGAEGFWVYFVWEKDGYRLRNPLFRTIDYEGHIDETKNESKKPSRLNIATVRYSVYHMYLSLPEVPSDILTRDLYKIWSDLRDDLQSFLIETKIDNVPIEVLDDWCEESLEDAVDAFDFESGPININEVPESVKMSEEEFLKVTELSQINSEFCLFKKLEKIAVSLTRMRRYMLDNT